METFDYKKWTFIAGMVALFAAAFAALVIGLTTWKTSNLPAGQVQKSQNIALILK
jgi:hypothetical protein